MADSGRLMLRAWLARARIRLWRGSQALWRMEEPLPPEPYWRVAQYADTIDNAWDDDERYRMLISDLPRRFHHSSRDRQGVRVGRAAAPDRDQLGQPAGGDGRAHRDHP